MPLAEISSDSIVLRRSGWSRPHQGRSDLIGVDRHGRLSIAQVDCLVLTEQRAPVFLGFPAGFGSFAPTTVILAYNGNTIPASELPAGAECRDSSLEILHGKNDIIPDDESFSQIWQALRDASFFVGNDRLAFRAYTPTARRAAPLLRRYKAVDITPSRGTYFICVTRSGLRASWDHDWSQTVSQLVELWLYDSGSESTLIPREASVLGMWYIEALLHLRLGFSIQYDSAQHTLHAHVQIASTEPRKVGPCRCSCVLPFEMQIVQLTWREPGWNPIVSGCVIEST